MSIMRRIILRPTRQAVIWFQYGSRLSLTRSFASMQFLPFLRGLQAVLAHILTLYFARLDYCIPINLNIVCFEYLFLKWRLLSQ